MSVPPLATDPEVEALVARAVAAQQCFASWTEARVDALLQDIAECVAERAEHLAAAAVAETGIGNVPDKTIKNRFASLDVYRALAGKPGTGLLQRAADQRAAKIASPVGVILGLIPMTSPAATFVSKTLIALKERNALILSCHCNAIGVGNQTGQLIQQALQRQGAPLDLVQWVREPTSRARTMQLMRHNDIALILATGEGSLVKAAYRSGTPAIGVGPGNAPAWICADADVDAAARLVIQSKSFDNGLICACENHLVVDVAVRQACITALETHGAAVLTAEETRRFSDQAFDQVGGTLRRDLIGQAAQWIGRSLDIQREWPIDVIVVPLGLDGLAGPYGRSKLAPILSLLTVDDVEEGLFVCKRLLARQGGGRTAMIHTHRQDLVERFAVEIAASRILVNAPGAQVGSGLEINSCRY